MVELTAAEISNFRSMLSPLSAEGSSKNRNAAGHPGLNTRESGSYNHEGTLEDLSLNLNLMGSAGSKSQFDACDPLQMPLNSQNSYDNSNLSSINGLRSSGNGNGNSQNYQIPPNSFESQSSYFSNNDSNGTGSREGTYNSTNYSPNYRGTGNSSVSSYGSGVSGMSNNASSQSSYGTRQMHGSGGGGGSGIYHQNSQQYSRDYENNMNSHSSRSYNNRRSGNQIQKKSAARNSKVTSNFDMCGIEDSSLIDIVGNVVKNILQEASSSPRSTVGYNNRQKTQSKSTLQLPPHSLKAVELANALRARIGTDVLAQIRERFGGLLSLLEIQSHLFKVVRIPKNDFVVLNIEAITSDAATVRSDYSGSSKGSDDGAKSSHSSYTDDKKKNPHFNSHSQIRSNFDRFNQAQNHDMNHEFEEFFNTRLNTHNATDSYNAEHLNSQNRAGFDISHQQNNYNPQSNGNAYQIHDDTGHVQNQQRFPAPEPPYSLSSNTKVQQYDQYETNNDDMIDKSCFTNNHNLTRNCAPISIDSFNMGLATQNDSIFTLPTGLEKSG